jgi:phage baseplate assembly protein W|tara:strand:- start:7480 stop:7851 length:372 start_codon:yes stop_codon:yes gene_type:complete
MATFIGFSTDNKQKPPYTLTDLDLVKQDLLNHFLTRKGERVMRPNFGSIIHDILMEPFDNLTKQDIEDECKEIVENDPRVDLLATNIENTDHLLKVELYLQYKVDQSKDVLEMRLEREFEREA